MSTKVVSILLCACMFLPTVVRADFVSCGSGYILTQRAKIDGVPAMECQKLWCRDLETGRDMGSGNTPARGYRATESAEPLCDATGKCVDCWGARVWCKGVDAVGVWNPQYGAYTRDGADNATYQSYLNGSCFTWRLARPKCDDGMIAIEDQAAHEWVCLTPTDAAAQSNPAKASGRRRTGALHRIFQ